MRATFDEVLYRKWAGCLANKLWTIKQQRIYFCESLILSKASELILLVVSTKSYCSESTDKSTKVKD